MRDAIVAVLVFGGLLVVTLAVYGVLRLPDVYTQLHASSKAAFVGVVLLLAAAAVQAGGDLVGRALLIAAVLAVTTPVAAHVVGRAAYRRGERPEIGRAADEG